MKRNLLILLLSVSAFSLHAYDVVQNGVYYNLVGNEAEVTYNQSSIWDDNGRYENVVDIPASITHEGKTYPVTRIGQSAFSYCNNLTAVFIGENVQVIARFAFAYCENMTGISIPNKVKEIGDFAFYNCHKLTNVILPSSVEKIGKSTFSGCSLLGTIHLPAAVKEVGDGVFSHCSALATITVDAANTTFVAKGNCLIHKANKTLVAGCAYSIIPDDKSVEVIGNEAFSGFKNLKQILIPATITTLGNYAFANCENLTQVLMSNSVTKIGGSAFAGCSSITSLQVPSKVTMIGSSAFAFCTGLVKLNLPNTLEELGAGAFAHCYGLKNLTITEGNKTFIDVNNCVIDTVTKTLVAGCNNSVIPTDGSITGIGDEAFAGCEDITELVLPASINRIGTYAFSDCAQLQRVILKSAIPPVLGTHVFDGTHEALECLVACSVYETYKQAEGWKTLASLTSEVLYELAVSSANEVLGTVRINQQPICENSNAIIEALPNRGYHFQKWSDGNTDNPRTVAVSSDTSFVALFEDRGVVAVTGIVLDTTQVIMFFGNAVYITATVLPENASNSNVVWSSHDDSIVIMQNGWVIAVGEGQTQVTATTEDGGFQASAQIIVKDTITGVDNVERPTQQMVHKVLHNGQIYIVRTNLETGKQEWYYIDGRRYK